MRVLIADDHDLLRDTLALYLEGAGIEARTAADLDGAERALGGLETFDLVLLDWNMPGMEEGPGKGGMAGLARALAWPGPQRVALISGEATREVAERALAAGAAGFVPKTLPAKSLVNAVRFMAMGEQYAPLDFMTAEGPGETHPLAELLSQRELQVLRGLMAGKSNKEIGRDLGLAEPTVKLHVKTLYRKIGASNRTQAAMIAKEQGLS